MMNQNPEVIVTLLKAGSVINAPDKDGLTALMCAAQRNQNSEVITTLVNDGADLTLKTCTA
jgi:ankyrin repeat protein